MFAIANMSKKATIVYLSILTLLFSGAIACVLYGILYITNGESEHPSYIIYLLIAGFILFFIVLCMIAITTIASNYVKKNPHKKPIKK